MPDFLDQPPDDVLGRVVAVFMAAADRPVSKAELHAVRDWAAMTMARAALLDQVLSGELEIVGLKEGEPAFRRPKGGG
jgi:hypothetical protein